MWIHVYPNQQTNINSKNSIKRSFSYETKALILLSYRGEYVYGTQSLEDKWLLCESEFIQLKNKL